MPKDVQQDISYEQWREEQMKDSEFRAAVEELAPGYQVARLRIMEGLTQKELAERVGTGQPSIARLESGRQEPSLSWLRKVACALGYDVEVRLVPLAERQGRPEASQQSA